VIWWIVVVALVAVTLFLVYSIIYTAGRQDHFEQQAQWERDVRQRLIKMREEEAIESRTGTPIA